MNQSFDTNAWRKVGEQLWSRAQQSNLVVLPWKNPWRRFAALALVPLVCAAAAAVTFKSHYALFVFALLSVPFVVSAIIFFIIARRTGGLYSFFSEKGFGVGCDADRILIPYSLIHLPQKVNLTTTSYKQIVLPLRAEITEVLVERNDGTASPWDCKPYKRGIVSVFIKDGAIHVKAFPNELIVHLFYAIQPLSVFLASRQTEQAAPEQGRLATQDAKKP